MKRPEEALHRALVAHLRARLPSPWLVFHPANGGGRSKAEAGVLKALGVMAGIPDLLVIGPGSRLIAIEVKAPAMPTKSGKPSTANPRLTEGQRSVIVQLGMCGVPTLIARDLDATLATLASMGVPLKGRAM